MTILNARQQLLRSLKGQEVYVPNMALMFQHWPTAASAHLGIIREHVFAVIHRFAKSEKKVAQVNKADLGLFTARISPHSSKPRAMILANLTAWMTFWDDELDITEAGELAGNTFQAQEFQAETIWFMEQSLGLAPPGQAVEPTNKIIAFFREIGEAVRAEYSVNHLEFLFEELRGLVEANEEEQARALRPELPSVQEYVDYRMYTSGSRVVLAFEFVLGTQLPLSVLADPDMQELWHATNIIATLGNDILTFKREVGQQFVDSLIPLLFQQCGDMELSVKLGMEMITQAVSRSNVLADRILARHLSEGLAGPLQEYFDSLRHLCTGYLHWLLESDRYGLKQTSMEGGVRFRL